MRKIKRFLFLLFLVLWSKNLFATAQSGDKLIVKGDTTWIHSNPLEAYFKKKGQRTIGDIGMKATSTALYRGYVATWKLENDSLFLVRVQTYSEGGKVKEIDISSEFGSNKVFAQWVTDTIDSQQGALLKYVHDGYCSIYEGEKYYTFEQGRLTGTREISYLEKDNSLLFPGIKFLHDTIRTVILKSIDKVERDSLMEKESSSLVVLFDKDSREIAYIGFGYREKREPKNINEKIILRNAKEALKGFPKLMKVNHHRYFFLPRIEIFFSGHCLKYPYDRKYGCKYE